MDDAVLIIAAAVLPESQRAVWPTKPWASAPETGAAAERDVDVVVLVVVVVASVVDSLVESPGALELVVGGGTAKGVLGVVELWLFPLSAKIVARIPATPSSSTVAITNRTCPGVQRRRRAGTAGAGTGGGAGYGVSPLPVGVG
ncbi:hypothetical protein [Mycobacterium sp. 852013-50091_SCH5140682]|uniref:hypothetical protein n=1 Tax=Mycobacterium sp. 852013-50091_SCH5140682 TaxID=1834109 RepID=UPI001E414B5B|nr:hypothetical protein [Mycobacterium sp. 852013-50091_SCH5140682]